MNLLKITRTVRAKKKGKFYIAIQVAAFAEEWLCFEQTVTKLSDRALKLQLQSQNI
jgi:hypothetical protein